MSIWRIRLWLRERWERWRYPKRYRPFDPKPPPVIRYKGYE